MSVVACLTPDDRGDTFDIGPVRAIPIIHDDDPRFEDERRAWSAARRVAQALHSTDDLLSGLRHDDWMVRRDVVDRLVARGHDDPRTARALREAATDPVWQVRDAAVMRLREFPSEATFAALKIALTDEHPDVRWAASFSLHQLGEDT